jgi:hypothetical protein
MPKSPKPEDRYIINYINRNYPGLRGCDIYPGVQGEFYRVIVTDQGRFNHTIYIKMPERETRRRRKLRRK